MTEETVKGKSIYDGNRVDGKIVDSAEDWSHADNKPLKRDDFVSSDFFFEWKSTGCKFRAQKLLEEAEKYTLKANDVRRFANDEIRRKVSRLTNLAKSARETYDELVASGEMTDDQVTEVMSTLGLDKLCS